MPNRPARKAARRSNFWNTLGTIVVAVLGVLVLVMWIVIARPFSSTGIDPRAAELCRANYRRARTAVDSQMVDRQRPVVSRLQATTALTCGVMRQTGHLR